MEDPEYIKKNYKRSIRENRRAWLENHGLVSNEDYTEPGIVGKTIRFLALLGGVAALICFGISTVDHNGCSACQYSPVSSSSSLPPTPSQPTVPAPVKDLTAKSNNTSSPKRKEDEMLRKYREALKKKSEQKLVKEGDILGEKYLRYCKKPAPKQKGRYCQKILDQYWMSKLKLTMIRAYR